MKAKLYLHIGLFLFFSTLLIAQSDYRITQEFKSRHRSFEIAIEYAKTQDELSKIKKEIDEFKNEFKGNKELLNRALYPSNFESSFTTLDKKIEYTNKKLTEITNLKTKVSQIETDYAQVSNELKSLSSEVYNLRKTNSKLITQLKAFKSGYGGSKESIDSLKNIVNQLKEGISKRDTLIKEIMDNIFMIAEHKIESLDDVEKKSIKTQIKSTSLIDNISNLINDNIEFLKASIFTSEDLAVLRNEFHDFDQRWSHFGPKLFDIYSTDTLNRGKLVEIDTLISEWNSSIYSSIWNSIHSVFSSHNINLDQFDSGIEFEKVVLEYIENQIQNDDSSQEVQKDQNYVFFAERVWNDIIKTEWMPLIYSDKLLTTDQISTIENKLAEWKDSSSGSKSYLIYGIIILLAFIILGSIYIIQKKNKPQEIEEELVTDSKLEKEIIKEKTENQNDIEEDEEFIDDKN